MHLIVLPGGRPITLTNMDSVGIDLVGGSSHFTWSCGFRKLEAKDKVPAKRVSGQSQARSNWLAQTRRAAGEFWDPTHRLKESQCQERCSKGECAKMSPSEAALERRVPSMVEPLVFLEAYCGRSQNP